MSVKGDDARSVNLLDLDYYSINEHITETDLYARIQNFSLGYLEPATLSILNSRINNSIASIPILPLVTSSDRIEDVGHRDGIGCCSAVVGEGTGGGVYWTAPV